MTTPSQSKTATVRPISVLVPGERDLDGAVLPDVQGLEDLSRGQDVARVERVLHRAHRGDLFGLRHVSRRIGSLHTELLFDAGTLLIDGGGVTGAVVLAEGVELVSHVVVDGHTTIGAGARIFPFASIGHQPQDLKFHGEATILEVGDATTIREYATLNRGTSDRGRTTVGSHCFIMSYAHIAHDCVIGNHLVISSHSAVAGHVHVGDHVNIGWNAGIHQFCRIGDHAMVAACSKCVQDVPPFVIADGNPCETKMINAVGLKRRGFSREDIRSLRTAYGLLFAPGGTMAERLNEASDLFAGHAGVMDIINFIREDSSRPICTPGAA